MSGSLFEMAASGFSTTTSIIPAAVTMRESVDFQKNKFPCPNHQSKAFQGCSLPADVIDGIMGRFREEDFFHDGKPDRRESPGGL